MAIRIALPRWCRHLSWRNQRCCPWRDLSAVKLPVMAREPERRRERCEGISGKKIPPTGITVRYRLHLPRERMGAPWPLDCARPDSRLAVQVSESDGWGTDTSLSTRLMYWPTRKISGERVIRIAPLDLNGTHPVGQSTWDACPLRRWGIWMLSPPELVGHTCQANN